MTQIKKTTLRTLGVAVAATALSASALAASIVSFNGPAGEAYIGKFITGIKATAEMKGYSIRVYENQFNQAEQDQQVQQVLAAGQLPDVFIWWPSDAVAGLGSLRALHRTGVPVLKINQLPNEQDKKYIFGFAGPDDSLRARNAGLMMVEAAKKAKAAGAKRFNVVAVTYPQSYGGYGLSMDAFKKAIAGSDLQLVGEVDEGFGQSNGYKGAAKMIAKLKAKGIDYVYGMDDATFTGAGIGRDALTVARWSLEAGGHVRTGMEDNVRLDRDNLAPSNAALVKQVVQLVHDAGREVASPRVARQLLGLAG